MAKKGVLFRIAGPVVVAKGIEANMYDLVKVGKEKLMGEVIQIDDDKTIIQVYEDTSGLTPGEPVENTQKPLSVELGPGLLTSIYDGIQPPPPDQVAFTYAVPTIIDEMTFKPMVFRDGEFIECEPLTEFEDYQFANPLGILPMHLSLHSEVATLPVTLLAGAGY